MNNSDTEQPDSTDVRTTDNELQDVAMHAGAEGPLHDNTDESLSAFQHTNAGVPMIFGHDALNQNIETPVALFPGSGWNGAPNRRLRNAYDVLLEAQRDAQREAKRMRLGTSDEDSAAENQPNLLETMKRTKLPPKMPRCKMIEFANRDTSGLADSREGALREYQLKHYWQRNKRVQPQKPSAEALPQIRQSMDAALSAAFDEPLAVQSSYEIPSGDAYTDPSEVRGGQVRSSETQTDETRHEAHDDVLSQSDESAHRRVDAAPHLQMMRDPGAESYRRAHSKFLSEADDLYQTYREQLQRDEEDLYESKREKLMEDGKEAIEEALAEFQSSSEEKLKDAYTGVVNELADDMERLHTNKRRAFEQDERLLYEEKLDELRHEVDDLHEQ